MNDYDNEQSYRIRKGSKQYCQSLELDEDYLKNYKTFTEIPGEYRIWGSKNLSDNYRYILEPTAKS